MFSRKLKMPNKKITLKTILIVSLLAVVTLKVYHKIYSYEVQNIFVDNSRNASCVDTFLPTSCKERGQWLQIGTHKAMYVYSAYFIRSRKRVYVIGVKRMGRVDLTCRIWYRSGDGSHLSLWETKTKVRVPDILPNRYVSTIFECDLVSADLPLYVSLVDEACTKPAPILCVNDASKPVTYERQFTVCLSPLHNDVNPVELVEWIELNRILGAEKFCVYKHSTSRRIDRVLAYYVNRNLVEIIQWQLPFPAKKIYYWGQTASLNDCLFRNKIMSVFIVNVDKDEYIIPRLNNVTTWKEMIKSLKYYADTYVFRSSFFLNESPDGPHNASQKEYGRSQSLVTFTRTVRDANVLPVNTLSKHMTRTANVDWAQVHKIPHCNNLTVPFKLGMVHHYRSRVHSAKHRVNDTYIIEKYGDALVRRIDSVLEKCRT